MVVIFIMGLLISIAVPQWAKSRERSRKMACLDNLHNINDAKDVIAMLNKLQPGDTVTDEELVPAFLKGTTFPTCPSGGTYDVKPIGEEAECSVHGFVGGVSHE